MMLSWRAVGGGTLDSGGVFGGRKYLYYSSSNSCVFMGNLDSSKMITLTTKVTPPLFKNISPVASRPRPSRLAGRSLLPRYLHKHISSSSSYSLSLEPLLSFVTTSSFVQQNKMSGWDSFLRMIGVRSVYVKPLEMAVRLLSR